MRLYFKLLILFIITQIMGMYAGIYILDDAPGNEYVKHLMVVETGHFYILYFILAVLFGATLFLLLSRLHISLLFTMLEIAVISATSSIFFYAVLKPFLADTLDSMVFAIIAALVFALLKQFFHSLKNIAAMVSSAGAGAVFGFTFSFTAALFFLLLLALYDYISVYKTKHMVAMANEIVKRDMAFTISAEHVYPFGKKSRLDLGTGDISLPIMVEVAAYSISPVLSLFAFGGAVIGALFVLFIAWKRHTVLPALPPIALGIFLSTLGAIIFGLV